MAANPIALPVTVDEYLHSVYEPDMDLVDGVLEDRNLGEMDHWRVQRALYDVLRPQEKANGVYIAQELRVQVSATRFRVPDTCLLPANRLPVRIATEPPLLCIEVLSPEDRLPRIRTKCQDYLRMGVPEVWVLDPERKLAHVLRSGSDTEIFEGILEFRGIQVSLDALFDAAQ